MADAVDQKLLRTTKFPPEFAQRVDMKKVNVEVMKKWIAGKISEVLGNEDDVVIEMCFNLLEGSRFPNIKVLQIQLGGFLEKDTASFCKELWDLCLSAQANAQGVPQELLEAKKLELIQEKIEAEKAAEAARRRREEERQREREANNLRQRDRGDRGRGRGRSGRGGRDFGRHRSSRSPPPHRGQIDDEDRRMPIALKDRYEPRGRHDRPQRPPIRDSRSPSRTPPRRYRPRSLTRSRSRSRTPPRRRSPRHNQLSPEHRRSRSPYKDIRDSKRRKLSEGTTRSETRARYTSTDRSRSPDPQRYNRRRRRSPSRHSSSHSPVRRRTPRERVRHGRDNRLSRSRTRSRSKSRSSSIPSRSKIVDDHGRFSKPHHNPDDLTSADVRKERNHDKPAGRRRYSDSISRSRSPAGRSRRRNTSSEASTPRRNLKEVVSNDDDNATELPSKTDPTPDNMAREKALREKLLASRKALPSET